MERKTQCCSVISPHNMAAGNHPPKVTELTLVPGTSENSTGNSSLNRICVSVAHLHFHNPGLDFSIASLPGNQFKLVAHMLQVSSVLLK